MLSIFSCVYWPSVCLLWRNVFLGLLPIFWLGCLFIWHWAAWAACIFWRLILCQFFICNYFLPFWGLSFILFMVSFAVQKLLSLISRLAQTVKNLPAVEETKVQSLDREDPLEKDMATHSSILAWRIPRTEEPGRLHKVAKRETNTFTFQVPFVCF